jgi:hypothetical protein
METHVLLNYFSLAHAHYGKKIYVIAKNEGLACVLGFCGLVRLSAEISQRFAAVVVKKVFLLCCK